MWICCLLASVTSLAQQAGVLRLAASTTIVDSGLYGLLEPRFLADTGYFIEIHPVGSGHALKLGRMGRVDVLLVHAPSAEQAFIAEGFGLARLPVMHNEFVLVGPANDPAHISNGINAAAALQKIAGSGQYFLSRADDSGTHSKEMQVWQRAGIDPYGGHWYRETGESMSNTLERADRRQAYTLTDSGTWLAMSDRLSLKCLTAGDPRLANPYSVIAINPARHAQVNHQAANIFIHWIRSPAIQQLIADYRKDGEQYFTPDALP